MERTLSEIISQMDSDDLAKIIELFARQNPDLEKMIRNAAAGKDAAYEAIKNDISAIKRSRRFYDWRSRGDLYYQLENILENIRINIRDAELAVKLLIKFFDLDSACCNNCDDSDGGLGYAFNRQAVEVFAQFAPDYPDKEKLTEIIYDLIEHNDYGCHDGVLEYISHLLPAENIRSLLNKEYSHSYILPDLAYALNDAPLFEKLLQETRPNGFSKHDYYELAECYLSFGDADKALQFADQIDNTYYSYESCKIHEKIYLATNNKDALKNLYCESFFKAPNESDIEKIKALFGEEFFNNLAQQKLEEVHCSKGYKQTDFNFLLEYDTVENIENYILERKDELSGLYYEADDLKKIKKICSPLTQSIILRIPLNYYLDNARSKYYSSAAKHLKTLDALATEIKDWRGVEPHDEYKKKLYDKHYRKYSFWEKYK